MAVLMNEDKQVSMVQTLLHRCPPHCTLWCMDTQAREEHVISRKGIDRYSQNYDLANELL